MNETGQRFFFFLHVMYLLWCHVKIAPLAGPFGITCSLVCRNVAVLKQQRLNVMQGKLLSPCSEVMHVCMSSGSRAALPKLIGDNTGLKP